MAWRSWEPASASAAGSSGAFAWVSGSAPAGRGRVARPGASQGVDGQVAGDGEQPGHDRAPAGVEVRGVTPGPQEGLLGQVLSQGRFADEPAGQAVDAILEAPHEGGLQVGVAGGQTGQQASRRSQADHRPGVLGAAKVGQHRGSVVWPVGAEEGEFAPTGRNAGLDSSGAVASADERPGGGGTHRWLHSGHRVSLRYEL